MGASESEPRLPIERLAEAHAFVVGLFLGAVVFAIGLAMVVMGAVLARAIGVVLVALSVVAVTRLLRRR